MHHHKSELRQRVLREQARLLLDAGLNEAALEVLDQTSEIGSDDSDTIELRVRVLETLGRGAELRQALSARLKAARAGGQVELAVELSLRLGGLHERAGETERARGLYRDALARDPKHRGVLRALLELSASAPLEPAELSSLLDRVIELEAGEKVANLVVTDCKASLC